MKGFISIKILILGVFSLISNMALNIHGFLINS